MEILKTHTEGQLVVMAMASKIQYERMRQETKKDNSSSLKPAIRPTKSFNKMSAEEIKEYYAGFPSNSTMQAAVRDRQK